MNQIQITTNTNNFGQETILFKINLERGFAYMQASKSIFYNECYSIDECSDRAIVVDSKKFLELWKNDPKQSEKHLAFGNESTWRKDYKFHLAEQGFSSGELNPVPLAYVHCYLCDEHGSFNNKPLNKLIGRSIADKKPYCAFTNGITRTIWLLANGAKCFPVMTDSKSYELLKLYAGIHEQEKLIQNML